MSEFYADIRQGGFYDTSLIPAPKRIIICCDGTWQSSVSNVTNVPSNVTRIARYLTSVAKDNSGNQWQQVVYYDAGIGTGVSKIEADRQGGTGSGFVGNVIEAYNFIVLNYNKGDQIFCIGFSRGAYTARAVAGLVTDIGVIGRRDLQDFPELYRLYQAHTNSHVFRKSATWREWVEGKPLKLNAQQRKDVREGRAPALQWEKRPHGAAPESSRWVEAIGVFDTVGSLGIPEVEGIWKLATYLAGKVVTVEHFGFHNVSLSPYIKNAYHAMALDEHRKPFGPTLWHLPGDSTSIPPPSGSVPELKQQYKNLLESEDSLDEELNDAWKDLVNAEMYEELRKHGKPSNLVQVWFPGVHINVGGGSDDLVNANITPISDYEGIAMVTLFWMMEQLREHLGFEMSATVLAPTDRFMLMRPVVEKLVKEKSKNSSHWLVKAITSILSKQPKEDYYNDGGKTKAMNAAAQILKDWATGPIIDSYEGDMKKAGSEYRHPGQYKPPATKDEKEPKLGKTNEFIHPTVKYRMEIVPDYKPVPLAGFQRNKKQDKDGKTYYEWSKGNIAIPEYKIGGDMSHERWLLGVAPETAEKFMGRLDKDYGMETLAAYILDNPRDNDSVQHGFKPNTDIKSFNGGFAPVEPLEGKPSGD